jgi:pimeloyl-ACP methyl ester carboxylesterase
MRQGLKKKLLVGFVALVAGVGIGSYVMYTADVPVEELLGKYARPPSKFMMLDDLSVHYRDTGSGDAILLLHGNSASLHTWDAWADHLDDEYRVIRLDLPGFGLTGSHPQGKYEVAYVVDFLQRFLAKLGVEKAHIAGNSHGGMLAWNYAVTFPDKVGKLGLLNAAGYPLKYMYFVFAVRDFTFFKLLYPLFTPRWGARLVVEATYGDKSKVTDDLANRYFDLHLRSGNRQAGIDMMPIYKFKDPERIKLVKAPTLIMWGDKDIIIDVSNADLFAQDIEGSKMIIYKGVGHMPMEEIPDVSVADFKQFLQSP